MAEPTQADPTYLLGRSVHEQQRLQAHGDTMRPWTERLFREAGIGPGMRIHDVGCGAGDVSLLCAELVGATGTVVGVDRDPVVLARARERIAERGYANVSFIAGDYRALPPGTAFDADVGRCVLMYAGDAAGALRSILPHLRPGGLVLFIEPDYSTRIVLPPLPTYDRISGWWQQLLTRTGTDPQSGLKLYPWFVAAGLPGPALTTGRALGGGADFFGYEAIASAVRSALPLPEEYGIATADEVEIDTLEERLRADAVAGGGVLALPMFVAAWAHKP